MCSFIKKLNYDLTIYLTKTKIYDYINITIMRSILAMYETSISDTEILVLKPKHIVNNT